MIHVGEESALNEPNGKFSLYRKKMNWILYLVITLSLCAFIWIHFVYSGWDWYNNHPKKLALTLFLTLTSIIGLLHIPKKTKWPIWIMVIIAIVIALISFI